MQLLIYTLYGLMQTICVMDFSPHGPLTRYGKLRIAHALGTFSPLLRVNDPDMQHGRCMKHVPWCMPGWLTSGFLWSRWRGKRSRLSRRMHNPQIHVSSERPKFWYYFVLFCFSHRYLEANRRGIEREFYSLPREGHFGSYMLTGRR